jgi:hypothetical protein
MFNQFFNTVTNTQEKQFKSWKDSFQLTVSKEAEHHDREHVMAAWKQKDGRDQGQDLFFKTMPPSDPLPSLLPHFPQFHYLPIVY